MSYRYTAKYAVYYKINQVEEQLTIKDAKRIDGDRAKAREGLSETNMPEMYDPEGAYHSIVR